MCVCVRARASGGARDAGNSGPAAMRQLQERTCFWADSTMAWSSEPNSPKVRMSRARRASGVSPAGAMNAMFSDIARLAPGDAEVSRTRGTC